jgi:hypothetical protein
MILALANFIMAVWQIRVWYLYRKAMHYTYPWMGLMEGISFLNAGFSLGVILGRL